MKAWIDVARPHEDILSGDLEMAVFAADLGSVMRHESGVREVYGDPRAFFEATYVTRSMRSLLEDVLGGLAGGGGDRVLQLRTPFGGGKTHTLLALYHLVTGRDRLDGIKDIEGLPNPGSVRVAVLSGVDLDPSTPRRHDGIQARTIWGELAWQLGGIDAYRLVERQDELGQAPGKDVLSALLPPDEPALILIDEALVYVEKAKAITRGDSTLGAQVLLFLQALTELVASHSRAAMVYSLQKSVFEAAGDETLLLSLDHLVARVDAKREPVSGDEVMRVVQKRLFSELGEYDDRLEVARGYSELYSRYRFQLAETEEQRRNAAAEGESLAERILQSYPFHPAFLDLMHQRWTTLPSYQRTRGALQFLATVVHALWKGGPEPLPLISPGDVMFADEHVRGAFFSQVGDREGYTGVLERDFTGANAGVKLVDQRVAGDSARLRRLQVGSRVAAATMLYSFGGPIDEDRGVLESELIAGLLAPELDRNLLTTALADLREELLFLHHSGRRYRFDKTPNLNQLLANEMDKFTPDEVTAAVRRELEQRIGVATDALLWPVDGAQIPDEEPVFRVAYLDPGWASLGRDERDVRLKELFERRGHGSPRAFRNALAFAMPSGERFEQARQAARRALAVQSLLKQVKSLHIEREQLDELRERGDSAARDLGATMDRAYELVFLPVAREGLEGPFGFDEVDLSARVGLGRLLHDRVMEGLSAYVFDTITPEKLFGLLNLGDGDGHRLFASCPDAVSAAFSYLQFPKLRSDVALRAAVAKGATAGVFGYVAMASAGNDQLEVSADLVRIGRPTAIDEVDLGAGAFLLAPGYARRLAQTEEVPADGGRGGDEGDGDGGRGTDGDGDGVKLPPSSGSRLRVELRVGKTEVFDALRILPALADESETMDVAISIAATAKGEYDRTWIRNAVREPLEEAGIEGNVEILDADVGDPGATR